MTWVAEPWRLVAPLPLTIASPSVRSGMVELAMALVLMNLGSTPEVSGPPVPIRPLMFVVDVGGDHVEAVTRQTLTEALVLTLARRLDLEVQSPRSVRDRLGFAEQQQQAGCDSSACMTESANAMGARFVVFSRVVRLANDEILRADIYDNVSGRTIALASVQARAVLVRMLPSAPVAIANLAILSPLGASRNATRSLSPVVR